MIRKIHPKAMIINGFLFILKIQTLKYYFFLVLAIAAELFATASLKKAHGFTVWLPSILSVAGYTISAYFLSHALKQIPIGIAYSIWASLGIASSVLIGYFLYHQKIDLIGLTGILLIFIGVFILTAYSKTVVTN